MRKGLARHQKRAAARRKLDDLFADGSRLRLIHYSCEGFYNREVPDSPRVTSIAVRHYDSGQTRSFSIHHSAEREGQLNEIEKHYDQLEKAMLGEFFAYVGENKHARWLHWNMRDANYGFAALEHRYSVLGGTPVSIGDDYKFDLAVLLKDIYGPKYAPHPRLMNIPGMNNLTNRNALSGADEAAALEAGEYVKLHQSTLAKVDLITELAELAGRRALTTKAGWGDTYGVSIAGVYDAVTDHAAYKMLGVVGLLFGVIASAITISVVM